MDIQQECRELSKAGLGTVAVTQKQGILRSKTPGRLSVGSSAAAAGPTTRANRISQKPAHMLITDMAAALCVTLYTRP